MWQRKDRKRCCYAPTDIGESFLSSALEFGAVWMKGVYEAGFKLIKKTPALFIWQNKEHFKYEDRVNDERNDGWSVVVKMKMFFFPPKNRMGSQDFYQLLSVLLSKRHVMWKEWQHVNAMGQLTQCRDKTEGLWGGLIPLETRTLEDFTWGQ